MNQYEISTRPRHLRYAYFITEKFLHQDLVKLLSLNLLKWGGRYNPIFVIKENNLTEYMDFMRLFDPDYIYFSNDIDIEYIKNLRIFNPISYFKIEDLLQAQHLLGVPSELLLPLVNKRSKLLFSINLKDVKTIMKDYFLINFGIDLINFLRYSNLENPRLEIDATNFEKLHEIIYTHDPINLSYISGIQSSVQLFASDETLVDGGVEIVIARNKSSISDLIYFWNRAFYQNGDALYLTLEELEENLRDPFFLKVLNDMSSKVSQNAETSFIYLVSTTLSEQEIDILIRSKLNPLPAQNTFHYRSIKNFPYKITNTYNTAKSTFNQILIGDSGLINVTPPSMLNSYKTKSVYWGFDVFIKKLGIQSKSYIQFPFTTNTKEIFNQVIGRINRTRNIFIEITPPTQNLSTLKIKIPLFQNLLYQLISLPKINSNIVETDFKLHRVDDAGNRLAAFLRLFNFDFFYMNEILEDKFLVDILLKLSTNESESGKTITLNNIKEKAHDILLNHLKIKLAEDKSKNKNIENFNLGLLDRIDELCNHKVFLKGFNLKCSKCSSNYWYHIQEIKDEIICKGCFENFSFPIEPQFSYKLNDLIRNNIFQSITQPDGNLTVIKTLINLYQKSNNSFQYSPQINLYKDYNNKPSSDLDIICLSDGQLIIGEAKHDSEQFKANNNKSLNALIEASKFIHPDVVLLSCSINKHSKLENAKKFLEHNFANEIYKLELQQ